MSEPWRVKKYYTPRVLCEVEHVLTPLFGDCLVCLTGSELYLLRNMAQYLHRRATFVSSYHTGYYLAPDEAEWDAIEEIVAGLEDKLMNCDQFTDDLAELLALARSITTEPYLTNIYRDLADDGTIVYELPDDTQTVANEDLCAVAQLVYAYQWEYLTETLEPIQEVLHSVLLSAVLGLITTAIGGPIAGLSAAAFTLYVTAALNAGVQSDLESVRNELASLKQDLVCALYETWNVGGTYADAAIAARQVIDSSEVFSPIDKLFMRRGFSAAFMEQAQAAWDAQTDWATGNVIVGYCDVCQQLPPTSWSFDFSAGVDGWTLGSGCSWGQYLNALYIPGAAADRNCYSPVYAAPEPGAYVLNRQLTGRGYDDNLRIYVDRSVNGIDFSAWVLYQHDTGTVMQCYSLGPYAPGFTWEAGYPYLRFRFSNRVSDQGAWLCSLDLELE